MVIYDCEQKKPDGMSDQTVIDIIKNESGVQLSWQTIQKKVKDRDVRTLTLRQGPKGNTPNQDYCNLCTVYKLFVTINQLNVALCMCRPQQVCPLVHKVIFGENNGSGDWWVLLKRVQNYTATNLRRQNIRNANAKQWQTQGCCENVITYLWVI